MVFITVYADGLYQVIECSSLEQAVRLLCTQREAIPLNAWRPEFPYRVFADPEWAALIQHLRLFFGPHEVEFPARNYFHDGYDYHLHEIVAEYDLGRLLPRCLHPRGVWHFVL